jgi:NADH:ubiquinone oxidoreductase subunit
MRTQFEPGLLVVKPHGRSGGTVDMAKFLLRLFTWWRVPTLGTTLFTWLNGDQIGTDSLGNRYYRERKGDRRWVMYTNGIEASGVPPEWDAWLHGTVELPPSEAPPEIKSWELEHVPNMAGTAAAYHPPGSLERGGHRDGATGDYEAWRPEG